MNRNLFVLVLLCFLFFLTGCSKKEEHFKEKNSFQKESQPLSHQQDAQLHLPGATIPMKEVVIKFGFITENKQEETVYPIPKELYWDLKTLLEKEIAYPQGKKYCLADMPEDYMRISFSSTTSLLICSERFDPTSGKDIYGNPIPHEEMMYINYLSKEPHKPYVYHSKENLMKKIRQFLKLHSLKGKKTEKEI